MKRFIYLCTVLCTLLLSVTPVKAQKTQKNSTVTVEGIVVDENNVPMPGITVNVQEKQTDAVTDEDGKFYMLLDPSDVLVVNLKGYRPVIKRLDNQPVYTLKMVKYLTYEDEMIGVSYGEQSKRSMTSAVSSIGTDVIEKNTVSSIEQAMNGTLSGLYSIKNGGEKLGKSNYTFYVRGMATNANAKPLILVDDIEANIDLMDFNEVESISVLKDASALAMYGMRGANGVILIKTKHGSEVKHSINVDIRAGFQTPEYMSDRLNAYQYSTLYNEALKNDGSSPMYNPDMYLRSDRDPYLYPDENYKDRFIGNSSPFQHYNFSASGGNGLARYFVTAGYMKQEGIFKDASANNIYERFNFRSNLDINPIKGMLFNILVSAAIDKNKAANTGSEVAAATNSVFNTLMTLPANAFPMFNKDGSLGGTSEYQTNPYGLLNRHGYRKDESRLLNVQVKGKYDLDMLLPGLSVDAYYGFENFNMQYLSINNTYAVFQENTDGTYTQFGKDEYKNSRSSAMMDGFYRYNTLGAGLNYNHTFGSVHDLAVRLFYNHSSETVPGDNPDYKYQGLAMRAQYGFNKRYYAEVTASYQGSSNYRSGKRTGFFPAVGLAWVASDEKWLQSAEAIDFLKFRVSYGVNGNDQTGGRRFPYRQEFTSSGGYAFGNPNGSTDGSQEGVLANPDETWEKSYKFNVGFDLELWRGFSFTMNYFNEKRRDVLVDYSNIVPSLIGIGLSKYNGGSIDNQGIDFNVLYNKQYKNGGFFVGGNMLWAKNKIIDLKEIAYKYAHQYRKGHSIGTRFGFETNGLYTHPDQLVNAPTGSFGSPVLGDIVYKNQNPEDDNVIDESDMVALGNSLPEIIFGATLGGNYKGFDIQCNLEGSSLFSTHYIPNKFTPYAYENRWNPNDPAVQTAYPGLSISREYNTQTSDFWQKKTSLLRISSAEVGYTFPKQLMKKIFLSSLRVYVNANNLFTFSNAIDGRNPEAMNAGYSEYPLLRTFSFGISIKL